YRRLIYRRLLDAQRPHLPRRRILRPEDNPHGVGIEVDIPTSDPGTHELLGVLGRETLGRGIEELHELHAMLQIRAAVATRGDADAHIVVELPAHESLRDLEQAADDDALEHDAVLAAEPARQNAGACLVEANRQELAPDLRMRPALALGLAIPLRLGAGGEIIPVQLEELGHWRVNVHASRSRGAPTAGNEISDIDFGHLNRIRQLARGALQLAQPTPNKLTDFDGALQGEGSRHLVLL